MLRAADTIAKTDTGRQRRGNEDCVLARPPVFVVADGMGGAQAGEVAAGIAVEAFAQGLTGSGTVEQRLASRAREANRRIFEIASTERERAGMGTTLTAAYLDDSQLAIAHVGDSRAYLFRDGALTRLTQDHSLVDELVRRGKLTEKEAAEHPQRSIITRALGPEPDVDVDTWTYPVRAGDLVLLCSDGLTSMISEERVGQILARPGELEGAAQALINEANQAGGRDNITVVLVRLEDVPSSADGTGDQPTAVGMAPPTEVTTAADSAAAAGAAGVASGALAGTTTLPKDGADTAAPRLEPERGLHETETAPSGARARGGVLERASGRREAKRPTAGRGIRRKPVAILIAVVIVLCLIVAGGYLASRQLYFIGTNSSGVVTIYRGLPYDLPAGIHLYETFYVSGVPASLVPPGRRVALLDNRLRSQSSAATVVRDLELGRITK
ncbi:MAG TPA: Stp1/IreP family PP2C-type Ser/Thr phosphatase [Solirubrobacteraceae bacterium]|nr:Stp1/IreP family PP2C-type Ser/Thr phosphatase [Solirubrobacteraceae bacterium]